MVWSGFLMEEEELDRRTDVLYNELSKLKVELSIDDFAKKVSDAFEIPFDIAKSYTLIANNRFCDNSFYHVLINIKRLLQTKMYCDVFEVCRAYGEEETYENAIKYMSKEHTK